MKLRNIIIKQTPGTVRQIFDADTGEFLSQSFYDTEVPTYTNSSAVVLDFACIDMSRVKFYYSIGKHPFFHPYTMEKEQ